MTPFVTAGAGFLLAVLWFDLMFDVQVRGHIGDLPEETLASISAYYRRVTTTARPMNRLVAVIMIATLAAIIAEIAHAEAAWATWPSLVLATAAIGLAGARTVPSAQRLGSEKDTTAARSKLARSIYHDHLLCFGLITTVLALQLAH